MMDSAYREIAKTYFRRRLMWVAWAYWGLGCFPTIVMILEGRGPSPLGLLVMFPFFISLIFGNHIASQMVHAHLSRLPDAPRKNLLVGLVMMGTFCIGLPAFGAWLAGASAWGTMSVLLAVAGMCLLGCTWQYHGRAFLLFHFIAAMFVFPVMIFSEDPRVSAVFLGGAPITTTIVSLIGLIAFGVASHCLLHLNDLEANFVYNRMLANWEVKRDDARPRGRSTRPDFRDVALGRLKRPVPPTLLARVRLWQRGSGLPRPWSFAMVIAAAVVGGRIVWQLMASINATTNAELNLKTIELMAGLSMLAPLLYCLLMRQRMRHFGVDSLKPTSRRRFVLENGLATALDCLGAWLIALVLLAVATKLLCPTLFDPHILGSYVLRAVCVQTFLFGVAAWLFAARSFWACLILALSALAAIIAAFQCLGHIAPVSPTILQTSTVLGFVGAVLIATAYRRWCNLEMARDHHWLSM